VVPQWAVRHHTDLGMAQRLKLAPNELAFSCCERAANHLQKLNDLAREAVCCNAGLGRNCGSSFLV